MQLSELREFLTPLIDRLEGVEYQTSRSKVECLKTYIEGNLGLAEYFTERASTDTYIQPYIDRVQEIKDAISRGQIKIEI